MVAAEQYVDNVFDYNRCKMVFRFDDELLVEREFVRQGNESMSMNFDMDLQAGDHDLVFDVTPLTPEQAQVRYLRPLLPVPARADQPVGGDATRSHGLRGHQRPRSPAAPARDLEGKAPRADR